MPLTSTTVTVYEVRPGGDTGAELGGGRLVNPRVVVVDPDVGRVLISQQETSSTGFRCGLAGEVDGAFEVEVIDAQELHQGDDDLTALSLLSASSLPPDSVPWGPCDMLRPRPWFC